MSSPRHLLPANVSSVTRRCSERRFFLRPSVLVNRILLYCLARAAQKYSLGVHAYCFMSSHIHLVLSDPYVELPDFMRDLDRDIAKCMNTELRRRENFWRPGSYDYVSLEDDEAVISSIVYTLMNPVAAGLVRRGHQWPGLRTSPEDLAGRHVIAPKAGRYFSSSAAELAEFDIVKPPLFRDLNDAELVGIVRQRVEEEEAACQASMAAKGRKFLGRKRVLVLSPMTEAKSYEPPGQLNPRVAAGDRTRRLIAIQRLKAFLTDYREAFKHYADHLKQDFEKAREVIFPAGTYLMRVRYSVQCQAPPESLRR